MITKTAIEKWERKNGHSTDPYVQMGIRWLKGEIVVKDFDKFKLTPKQAAKIRAEFNARVKAAYEAN
jgi:hypothetical protein